MSRIGKLPVALVNGVKVGVVDGSIRVEGPKGALERKCPQEVSLQIDAERVTVVRADDSKRARSMHGLIRSLVANMVTGVTRGFEKTLELRGTGYRVEAKGPRTLVIDVGFSHKVEFALPEGISAAVGDKNVKVTLAGSDKRLVGQVAADIRRLRPPEPYKGKGIRYEGEVVRKKAGKAGAKAATTAAT